MRKFEIFSITNVISLLRILWTLFFIYFFSNKRMIIPIFFIVLIILTDYLDGKISRKLKTPSSFGNFIDRFSDNFVIVVIMLYFIKIGLLNPIIPTIIILRDIFILDFRYIILKEFPQSRTKLKTHFLGKVKITILYLGIMVMVFNKEIATYIFYLAIVLSIISGYAYIKQGIKYLIKSK